MRRYSAVAICIAAVAVVLFFTSRLMAARVVVDDISIMQDEGCSRIKVSFNFPVQYIKHFPYGSGEDLRIQLSAILTGAEERAALYTYENVQLPYGDIGELTDIAYEGNVDGGPYLNFFFDTPVKFKVAQGKDFRSLLVVFSSIGATGSCDITPM